MTDGERMEALRRHPLTRGSVSVPSGWLGVVERMYGALPADARVSGIKEKWGRLDVTAAPWTSVALAVARAEGEAARTCQVCGLPARPRMVSGWAATVCGGHWDAWRREGSLRWTDPGAGSASAPVPVFVSVHDEDGDEGPEVWLSVSWGGRGTSMEACGHGDRLGAWLEALAAPQGEVYAVDPEATARRLDEAFFRTVPRTLAVRDAPELLHGLGSPDEVATALAGTADEHGDHDAWSLGEAWTRLAGEEDDDDVGFV